MFYSKDSSQLDLFHSLRSCLLLTSVNHLTFHLSAIQPSPWSSVFRLWASDLFVPDSQRALASKGGLGFGLRHHEERSRKRSVISCLYFDQLSIMKIKLKGISLSLLEDISSRAVIERKEFGTQLLHWEPIRAFLSRKISRSHESQ